MAPATRRKLPKIRGVRTPEELPTGKWRVRTYNRVTKRYGPSKTFEPDQYNVARVWVANAQARLDAELDAAEAGGAASPAAVAAAAPTVAGASTNGGVTDRTASAPEQRRLFAAEIVEWSKHAGDCFNTRRSFQSHSRALARLWPTQAVDEITKDDVRRMMSDARIAGLSSATVSNRLSTLRAFMLREVETGGCAADPTAGVKRGKWVPHREHRPPGDDEFDRALAKMPERLKAALLLARDSGMRNGEVCAVRPRHLDLAGEKNPHKVPAIWIQPIILDNGQEQSHPKGREPEWVPLTARTVEALETLLDRHPCGPDERIFRTPHRRKLLTPDSFRVAWRRARKEAGLQPPFPRIHDARHGLGHDLHQQEAPAQLIQRLLRHANLETSRRYMPPVSLVVAFRWTRKVEESRRSRASAVVEGNGTVESALE